MRPIICAVFLGSVLGLAAIGGAEEAAAPDPAATPAASITPDELEVAIGQIVPPVDQAQVDRLTAAVKQLEDPTEQERLGQALQDRLKKIAAWVGPEATDETLTKRLDTLNLGDEPSEADLDARDEALSAIERVDDPARRERLLDHLRDRERQAGTLVTAPKPSR